MEYRFCPICGTYLEKNHHEPQSVAHCPLGHFTVQANVTSLLEIHENRAIRMANHTHTNRKQENISPVKQNISNWMN